MRLRGILPGDIVQVRAGQWNFYALVERTSPGELHVRAIGMPRGSRPARVTAGQVIEHWRKSRRGVQ